MPTMAPPLRRTALVACAILAGGGCNAFTVPSSRKVVAPAASSTARCSSAGSGEGSVDRRSVLSSLLAASAAVGGAFLPSEARAEAETMERGGVPLTPFNSLAFNYRGGGSPTIDASKLNEDSIPYAEFLEKLNADQVAFVEFLAPNGDAAYATFKTAGEGEKSKPIRIGEGYPIEDPEGWSSPAFVIKAVAKKGVPYKFVVPGLSDSFM